jgi:hypothetical protein
MGIQSLVHCNKLYYIISHITSIIYIYICIYIAENIYMISPEDIGMGIHSFIHSFLQGKRRGKEESGSKQEWRNMEEGADRVFTRDG